jgi:hypothetical protein
MNSAAALLPRILFNRAARSASTSLERRAHEPARRVRRSVDAEQVLTRTIAAGTLHTRWA